MDACALLLSLVLAVGAVGQTQATVSGTAAETVQMLPSAMQMVVTLQAEGKTLDEAIAAVQGQTDEVLSKLGELKPVEGTLTVKGPQMAGPGGSEGSTYRQMMVSRAMGRFTAEGEAEEKHVLSAVVSAEWALSSTDAVSLLREAQMLREAVEAVIPKGVKPEVPDEESEEEMLMMMDESDMASVPNKPSFAYVARLSDEALAKARRSAFQKASHEARSLAGAAGMGLGALMGVSSNVGARADESESWRYAMMMMTGTSWPADNQGEARSPGLRMLELQVSVSVTYALEPQT